MASLHRSVTLTFEYGTAVATPLTAASNARVQGTLMPEPSCQLTERRQRGSTLLDLRSRPPVLMQDIRRSPELPEARTELANTTPMGNMIEPLRAIRATILARRWLVRWTRIA